MVNMKHCRFENTYRALKEVQSDLDEKGVEQIEQEADQYERPYVKKLVELCREITEEYAVARQS